MDPHSTRSQFNCRTPKAGPPSRSTSEKIFTQDTPKMPPKKKAKTDGTPSLLIRRPIATNSRIRQDEILKKDLYLSFVTNALQLKLTGDIRPFDELVGHFNNFATSSLSSSKLPLDKQTQSKVDAAEIRLWLAALTHVVSRLERTHATLVDAIVNMPWMTLDNATVKSYTIFIGMLLSARPEYLSLVLAKIAQGFTYQSGMQALDFGMPSTSQSPLTRRTVYERFHYLLRHLLSLIPTLPSTLQPFLVRYFPHKRQNRIAQTTYIRNLLRVTSYCPELSDKILATIVDRAIQIDVEIQVELEELETQETLQDGDIFELDLDPFDAVVGEEPVSDSDTETEEEDTEDAFSDLSSDHGYLDDTVEMLTNVSYIAEMVKKLDAILFLLFEHFEKARGIGIESNQVSSSLHISQSDLPPLPPLDMGTPSLGFPSTPILGSPFTQSPSNSPLPTPPVWTSTQDATATLNSMTNMSTNKENDKVHNQFHTLLSIFDRTILRTFKSRYTQFLVFWYTSLDPDFADIFQGMLVERALMSASGPAFAVPPLGNENAGEESAISNANIHFLTPEVTRAAAASYIGSFVSRATFVDRDGTRRVVGILCDFIKAHLDGVDEAIREGVFSHDSLSSSVLASGQHMVFYAVTQAVFLIFCFRWRDLTTDRIENEDELGPTLVLSHGLKQSGSGKGWMPEIYVLKRAVSSVLNPLKVCSSNVVTQFTRVAHATDFLYCYSTLDANKRAESSNSPPRSASDSAHISTKLNPAATHGSTNNVELNAFFPFDPCHLPRSNAFIRAVYREWGSVAIEGDDDDDDEEEEEEDADADADEGISAGLHVAVENSRPGTDDVGIGESFGAMSISPPPMTVPMSITLPV